MAFDISPKKPKHAVNCWIRIAEKVVVRCGKSTIEIAKTLKLSQTRPHLYSSFSHGDAFQRKDSVLRREYYLIAQGQTLIT